MTTASPSDGPADDPVDDSARPSRRARFRPTDITSDRGTFRLLVDPTFGPHLFGKLVSSSGIWIYNIAAAIVVYEMTGSTLLVGAVSVLQFIPQLIIGPISGARADRDTDRRRQIIVGRAIVGTGSGGLAAALWLTGLEGYAGASLIVISAGVVGVGFAVGAPAMQAILPSLVHPKELPTAIALDTFPITVARTTGPAVGALIVVALGGVWAFALGAITSLVYMVVMQVIRVRDIPRRTPADGSVREAVRYLKVDRGLPLLLFGVAAVGFAADPVITLTPALADDLGGGSVLVGWLASAFGIGSSLVFMVLGKIRRRWGVARVATFGLVLMAVGMVALIPRPSPELAMAALGVAGGGMMAAVTALSTQIQQRIPEELRGRVMALWAVAFLGVRPFAAGMNSALTDLVALDAAFALVTTVLMIAIVLTRASRIPEPPAGSMAIGSA